MKNFRRQFFLVCLTIFITTAPADVYAGHGAFCYVIKGTCYSGHSMIGYGQSYDIEAAKNAAWNNLGLLCNQSGIKSIEYGGARSCSDWNRRPIKSSTYQPTNFCWSVQARCGSGKVIWGFGRANNMSDAKKIAEHSANESCAFNGYQTLLSSASDCSP